MKILSLFDGISCARVALEKADIPVESYYASEIDKYAIAISKKNYLDIIHMGNVTELSYNDLSKQFISDSFNSSTNIVIDLLIGGSPCQDLSIAKKNRKGLDGERSGLFWEYVRILKEVKPKYFILENVASMPKEAKDIITETLGVEPIMINAALVSAQNRKRLFWVGAWVDNIGYVRVDVTHPKDRGILLKDILEKGEVPLTNYNTEKYKSNTVRTSGRGSGINDKHNWDTIRIGQIGKGGQGDRIYSIDGKSVNLSANGGGRGAKTGLYAIVPEATKKGYAVATEGQSVDMSFLNSKTRRGRVGDKVKNLMTSQNIGVFTQGVIRKLTPIECERLQSLPDNYTDCVSNTQRYKALGNGFNVDVIAHILSFIK